MKGFATRGGDTESERATEAALKVPTALRRSITRRRFLGTTAAAATAFGAVARPSLAASSRPGPNDKLDIAFVGVGGRGGDNLAELAKLEDVNVVALCDVDADALETASKRYGVPSASTYRDFRILLDKERSIDAVVVSIPDHSHAVVSMAAIRLEKHVYCEKPLTRTIFEAREVAKAARAAGVVTQMGNQGMAFEGNRQIKEWLADGAIGAVREVHVWSDRPTHSGKLPLWWQQGIERPKDTRPPPANLDWDTWLGPAPERPFHPEWGPFRWRGWWDFGSGGLGDMGIHNIAPAFDALRLDAPTSVHASSTPVYPETVPLACTVHYEFPARGDRPALSLHWYDGGMVPARPEVMDDDIPLDREDGMIIIGESGTMLVKGWGGRSPQLLPSARDKEYRRPAPSLPRSIGHHAEWVRACKGDGTTASSFDFAGPLTETLLVGSVCVRLGGEKLRWESEKLEFRGSAAANALVHYQYRKGWTL